MVYPENGSEYTGRLGHGSKQLPWTTSPLLYSNGLSDAAGWFVPHPSPPPLAPRFHEPRTNISLAMST